MSLDIWMRCEGPSRVGPLTTTAWRVVEAQHKISTRRLVDTQEEQTILEEIVDEVKPPLPSGDEFKGLHFLLFTPFRHPPLLRGTRFGSSSERSIFYSAEEVETSLAEKSYYQLLFLQGTKADLKNMVCDWSAFTVDISTGQSVDLTSDHFAEFRSELRSPTSYEATQKLGTAMRSAGVVAFKFGSSRCPKGGTAIGLFKPAFSRSAPGELHTWKCVVTADGCEVYSLNTIRAALVFTRASFEVDGVLPSPST
jgi:hypothetical protein